jgi:hypothetical protein
LVVTTSVAREALGSVDFPAVGVAFGRGKNCYEALLLRQRVVSGLSSVELASAKAAVELGDGEMVRFR